MWENNARVCKKRAKEPRDCKNYRRSRMYVKLFKKVLLRCVNLSPHPGFVFTSSSVINLNEPIITIRCQKTVDALQQAREHKSLFAITH